ncbi:MAG: gliding motility-associated C-terminal domain-containing protein [Flavobacteriales bacterium]|nr:gliding motility-associated C-terminal domain-containing protein [Flavobacteriales bacterium]
MSNIYRLIILSAIAGLSWLPEHSYATHNRAGEITYKRLNGTTYEITITTYTDVKSTQADRCELGIFFGDGKSDTIPRVNNENGSPCNPSINCDCRGDEIENQIKKNIYSTRHTYAGPGEYFITMEDPNRVDGIKNIPNSVSVPFTIRSRLIIDPSMGSNSSPTLNFAPVDQACLCSPFYHNPGAVDPDGDSLSYSLDVCLGANGATIPGYEYPRASCPKNTFSIDPRTGTLTWDGPGVQGQFNVCILITEWRKENTPRGQTRMIGQVLRDMQVDVLGCRNQPPEFEEIQQICVTAGDTISEVITAFDSPGERVTLTGTGEPLLLINSPAIFPNPVVGLDTVRSKFYWKTQCSHINNSEYLTTFKAVDNGIPVELVNFMTIGMRVVGPAVQNMRSSSGQNKIAIAWDPSRCTNAKGYEIYRKIDSTVWIPSNCEIGIPESLGYTKIDYVEGYATNYYEDDAKGKGLYHGQVYCYRIVAVYEDGARGYASEEICNKLPFDVPIINRSSVFQTSKTYGGDSIAFAKPQHIDLSKLPPPYSFKLYHSESFESAENLISESPLFLRYEEIDTVFRIETLNTLDGPNAFRFELFSADSLIGTTHVASSIYLKIGPDDRKLHLEWKVEAPWYNFEHIIYKEINGEFSPIDTTQDTVYVDSNLINLKPYRYYVKTRGKYSIDELPDTIINLSQIQVGIPKDTIPPCVPEKPMISSECELYRNKLSWQNPNPTCSYKDAVGYKVYFTPRVGLKYKVLEIKNDINDTSSVFDELESVAGCYAISAVDTFNNESDLSERVCVDNCPLYELPNVFTPGKDGINDFFHPILPFRYIQDIEIHIFNRWGQEVFSTTDPHINWDGTNLETQKPCPTGVYFYVCNVNEIRLSGINTVELKGSVTLIRNGSTVPTN